MRQPGADFAKPSNNPNDEEVIKRPKKGNQKGKGKDIGQVDDVGKQLGMDEETRGEFGDFLEEEKRLTGRGDFSFQELIEKAKEFLGFR